MSTHVTQRHWCTQALLHHLSYWGIQPKPSTWRFQFSQLRSTFSPQTHLVCRWGGRRVCHYLRRDHFLWWQCATYVTCRVTGVCKTFRCVKPWGQTLWYSVVHKLQAAEWRWALIHGLWESRQAFFPSCGKFGRYPFAFKVASMVFSSVLLFVGTLSKALHLNEG